MDDFYGTAVGFSTYATARGYSVADFDTDEVEAALLVASDYIDGKYGDAFRSSGTYKTGGRAQVREWPRIGYVDGDGYPLPSDTVPREIPKATYEATFRQLASPGSLTADYNAAKAYKAVSIADAVSVQFAGAGSAAEAQTQFIMIDRLLAPLLSVVGVGGPLSGMSGRVVRT